MAIVKAKRGTRGARGVRFGNLVMRVMRNRMVKMHRKQGDTFRNVKVLYLSTVGAKTGKQRTTPLGYVADGDSWLIFASMGGSAANPAWYHNIVAHPDKVSVEVGGRHHKVTPEQLEGEARAKAWDRFTSNAPDYLAYQAKTDRVIPLIRLTPAG